MNYEEMLQSRDGSSAHGEQLPLGTFYKKQIDKKYHNVVELKPRLTDNIVFCEALKADAKLTESLKHPAQLHFALSGDGNSVKEVVVEAGNYQTFRQMLNNTPAVVAEKDYTDRVVEQLASILNTLHERQVYQCCLAQKMVFAKKNDNMPLLLWHGSLYKGVSDRQLLYAGMEDDVAPEVLSGGAIDERTDVFALGRFIMHLHDDGSLPYEYKAVVDKATAANPEERYSSIDEMLAAAAKRRSSLRSAITVAAAVAIALLAIVLYIDLMPEQADIEYVRTEQEDKYDPYDTSLTPAELGIEEADDTLVIGDDTLVISGQEEVKVDAELERLFRRQFKRETERVFSQLYNEERKTPSGQQFIAPNRSMLDDLDRKRDEIAAQAGLPADIAEYIANQVKDEVMAERKLMLEDLGFQKGKSDE